MRIERSELTALLGLKAPSHAHGKPSSKKPNSVVEKKASSIEDLAGPSEVDVAPSASDATNVSKGGQLVSDVPAQDAVMDSPAPAIASGLLAESKAPILTNLSAAGTADTASRFTEVHRELGFALPNLWNHARAKLKTTKEQRQKLRTLLAWVATKKGWVPQERASMRYSTAKGVVDGKVDLLIHGASGGQLMAVEIDWTTEAGSLAKLKAAHEAGYPVLWVCGVSAKTKDDAKAVRRQTREVLGWASSQWLLIYHLEHGWV